MPKPSWENLDDFLSTDDFAVVATITPQSGAQRFVKGIFDDPYFNSDIGEYEADLSHPRFTCKFEDVDGLKRGDSVSVQGEFGTFTIMSDPQRDGTGMAVLRMSHDNGP